MRNSFPTFLSPENSSFSLCSLRRKSWKRRGDVIEIVIAKSSANFGNAPFGICDRNASDGGGVHSTGLVPTSHPTSRGKPFGFKTSGFIVSIKIIMVENVGNATSG